MNMPLRTLALAALAAGAVSFMPSPAGASVSTTGRYYPDPQAGPYYMEMTDNLLDPESGSGWAFGLINTCSVPHVASVSYYAYYAPGHSSPTYELDAYTYDDFSAGGGVNIESLWVPEWTPYPGGATTTEYLPEEGDDGGRGDPTYVTVPSGWNYAYASQHMIDNNGYGLAQVVEDNFYCTECGQGCPP